MSDATAKPLLYLCRRRAYLLRRTLEALAPATTAPETHGHAANAAMDKVDFLLSLIENGLKAQKEREDGRDSD